MVTLALSTWIPGLQPPHEGDAANWIQNLALYGSLYIVALGTGGIKPNVSAFGADQFDMSNPQVSHGWTLEQVATMWHWTDLALEWNAWECALSALPMSATLHAHTHSQQNKHRHQRLTDSRSGDKCVQTAKCINNKACTDSKHAAGSKHAQTAKRARRQNVYRQQMCTRRKTCSRQQACTDSETCTTAKYVQTAIMHKQQVCTKNKHAPTATMCWVLADRCTRAVMLYMHLPTYGTSLHISIRCISALPAAALDTNVYPTRSAPAQL